MGRGCGRLNTHRRRMIHSTGLWRPPPGMPVFPRAHRSILTDYQRRVGGAEPPKSLASAAECRSPRSWDRVESVLATVMGPPGLPVMGPPSACLPGWSRPAVCDRFRGSLARGNQLVPSRWQATASPPRALAESPPNPGRFTTSKARLGWPRSASPVANRTPACPPATDASHPAEDR